MVIKDITVLWRDNKKQFVKESTYSAYCLLLTNHIIPYFGNKEEFVEDDVQQFVLKSLKDGLSEKTIKDIIVVIKMIQKFGAKNKLMPLNQIDVLFPSKTSKKSLEIMSKDNQKKLFEYLKENFSFKNLGIVICLCTGMRIGELCALKWNSFDMDNNVVKVRHTVQRIYVVDEEVRYTKIVVNEPKTKESNRDIPLSSELIKIIKPLMKIVNYEFYVLSNEEKPIEPRTYRNYYKRVLKNLGIPYLKFHGLRHSFATRCIESKNSVKTVSVILGHSNITTTMNLYVHPDNAEKKRCIEKMLKDIL
ncbi:MAG: site-specific integrase [Erysipelotrichaceae bacterium]|nr:site-specific integrase [Erysipelotrichaceae bacterium]